MDSLIKFDLYLNAFFQMACNYVRRVGLRSTWILIVAHVGALYFFLVCAGLSATSGDTLGLVFCCFNVVILGVFIVRVFYEAFLVLVGEGALVDEMRLKFQKEALDKRQTFPRLACLVGALLLFMVDSGTYVAMETFSYGFLLLSLGMYLETCV